MATKVTSDLDGHLIVRINTKTVETFKKRSTKKAGKHYSLLIREIVDAFNSGRLRIIPTDHQVQNQLNIGELYNVAGK